uniref:DUF4283 domain-containing protein n=1 Tax=Tanacetum cinerariifolium TaxID=118510 RepID=A0A6L2L9W7_TANCI|nr:hypothetical protein [Tanacetum cinerariifolium]
MEESLPTILDDHVKELTNTQIPIYVVEVLIMERKQSQADVAKMIADVDLSVRNYMTDHILHVHPTQASQASTQERQYQLYLTMKDNLQLQHADLPICIALKIKFEGLTTSNTLCKSSAIYLRDQDDPHDDAHPKGENIVQSYQRDSKAPALSLVNQDLFYLKKVNSRPGKIVLSLHKFPAVIFSDDNIEERTSRWVNKCVKKFNPYARYSVKHWKNPHAKIIYIKRQKEPRKPIEESKIFQVIKTTDYKNLNKNDIEDIYLLCINGKVDDYDETRLLWSLWLKSYKNDVKHGYVTPSLSKEDSEYLRLFEEEIEERLKHRDQMRQVVVAVLRKRPSKTSSSGVSATDFVENWGGRGRCVKEKQQRSANIEDKDTIVVSSPTVDENVDSTMNTEDVNVGQTPTSPTVNSKPGTSYVNLFTTGLGRKAMNFHTLFTSKGNGVDVVVSVESIRAISARFANTVYELFLGKCVAYPIFANYVRNTWDKHGLVKSMLNSSTKIFSFHFSSTDGLDAMLKNGQWFIRNNPLILQKWNPDVNLLKEYMGNVPMHILDECPNNIDSNMVKNMKKPSQTPRGVLVGPKVGFKPVKQVYRQVARNNNIDTNGNNKKDAEPTIEVSNSNPFDVLNLIENDVDLERVIIEGKVILVDDEGKSLKNVNYSGNHDSEDEVASTDNDMANFLASKKDGYGNNSLLEQ